MIIKEAAKKWGVGVEKVRTWFSLNFIPGAKKNGQFENSPWVIPDDAEKPDPKRMCLEAKPFVKKPHSDSYGGYHRPKYLAAE